MNARQALPGAFALVLAAVGSSVAFDAANSGSPRGLELRRSTATSATLLSELEDLTGASERAAADRMKRLVQLASLHTGEGAEALQLPAKLESPTSERARPIAFDHPRLVRNIVARQEMLLPLVEQLTGGEKSDIGDAGAARIASLLSVQIIMDAEARSELLDLESPTPMLPPAAGMHVFESGGARYIFAHGTYPEYDAVHGITPDRLSPEEVAAIPVGAIVSRARTALSYQP